MTSFACSSYLIRSKRRPQIQPPAYVSELGCRSYLLYRSPAAIRSRTDHRSRSCRI
jgi:hypothetical protein